MLYFKKTNLFKKKLSRNLIKKKIKNLEVLKILYKNFLTTYSFFKFF